MSDKVMVVCQHPDYAHSETLPMPPVGSVGQVLSGPDSYREYDVLFDGWPCPTVDGPYWVVHEDHIVWVPGVGEEQKSKSLELIT